MGHKGHKDGDELVSGLRKLEKLAIEKKKRERFLIWLLRRVDERNREIAEGKRYESGSSSGGRD